MANHFVYIAPPLLFVQCLTRPELLHDLVVFQDTPLDYHSTILVERGLFGSPALRHISRPLTFPHRRSQTQLRCASRPFLQLRLTSASPYRLDEQILVALPRAYPWSTRLSSHPPASPLLYFSVKHVAIRLVTGPVLGSRTWPQFVATPVCKAKTIITVSPRIQRASKRNRVITVSSWL
jgi:hypothetical protein